ncbi:hypothetical protein GGX14DRAFT_383695, partial [Mycena pura]
WVVVVPFALPGETIRVKVYRNARMHSVADLLEITTPNLELRDNSRVQCKLFRGPAVDVNIKYAVTLSTLYITSFAQMHRRETIKSKTRCGRQGLNIL